MSFAVWIILGYYAAALATAILVGKCIKWGDQ
ncbi:hypothetical protein J2S59_000308 [Nocardioides massiliensis]|uniref:Uncharacterized protein n=1 Tax=Nocardioides massiliensis TaxID=1325935 RepID=A0ABT9NJT0_9ACTN|nr:hypothetical protein [Nocardioides massiliensis]